MTRQDTNDWGHMNEREQNIESWEDAEMGYMYLL